MNKIIIEEIIKKGLIEDINYFDAATDLLIPENQRSKAKLIAKADGVVAGIEVFEMVFKFLSATRVIKRPENQTATKKEKTQEEKRNKPVITGLKPPGQLTPYHLIALAVAISFSIVGSP